MLHFRHRQTAGDETSCAAVVTPFADPAHAKPVLQRLLMITDASLSVAEFQRLCELACDVDTQPAWNWCVRLGSALSVATALGAVYVRCGRLGLARASG